MFATEKNVMRENRGRKSEAVLNEAAPSRERLVFRTARRPCVACGPAAGEQTRAVSAARYRPGPGFWSCAQRA